MNKSDFILNQVENWAFLHNGTFKTYMAQQRAEIQGKIIAQPAMFSWKSEFSVSQRRISLSLTNHHGNSRTAPERLMSSFTICLQKAAFVYGSFPYWCPRQNQNKYTFIYNHRSARICNVKIRGPKLKIPLASQCPKLRWSNTGMEIVTLTKNCLLRCKFSFHYSI